IPTMKKQERDRLNLFVSIVEKIKNSRFVKEGCRFKFELSYQEGQPLQQSISGYDEEEFRSVLMDVRKFTLSKDGLQLDKICTRVARNAKDPKTIKNVEDCKMIYVQLKQRSPAIKLLIDGVEEGTEAVLQKWLYGHYFHEQDEN